MDYILAYLKKRKEKLEIAIDASVCSEKPNDNSGMFRDTINYIVRQQREEQDRIVKQAFQNHFHFPIEEVEDMSGFERIIRSDSTVHEFRYKGEGFLLWDESYDLNVEPGINYWRGTLTAKYVMI